MRARTHVLRRLRTVAMSHGAFQTRWAPTAHFKPDAAMKQLDSLVLKRIKQYRNEGKARRLSSRVVLGHHQACLCKTGHITGRRCWQVCRRTGQQFFPYLSWVNKYMRNHTFRSRRSTHSRYLNREAVSFLLLFPASLGFDPRFLILKWTVDHDAGKRVVL